MALHSTGNHNRLTDPGGNPINFVINPGNLDNPTNPGYHPLNSCGTFATRIESLPVGRQGCPRLPGLAHV